MIFILNYMIIIIKKSILPFKIKYIHNVKMLIQIRQNNNKYFRKEHNIFLI